MSNQLAVIGGAPPALVGQRKSLFNAAAQANVQASFAVISYKGKNWRIKYRGEATLLTDERGLPQQALDIVVVGVASGISKQYYGKGFTEGDNAAPDCFSVNGTAPDTSSPKKQASVCASCPMNQWGSKITEQGTKAKACQDSRRIAIVPDGDLRNEGFGGPVMLRLPPTTLANFAQYGAMLDKRGAGMEYVVTRMTFDHDVAYPKIQFAPLRWLTQDEAIVVVGDAGHGGVCAEPAIERMLNEAAEEVVPETADKGPDPLAGGAPAEVFAQPAPAAAVDPVPVAVVEPAPTPAAPAAPAPTPVAAAATAKGFGGAKAAPVAQAVAPVAASKGFGVPKAVVAATVAAAPVTAPVQPAQVVYAAPSDMEAAIDNLLNAPI